METIPEATKMGCLLISFRKASKITWHRQDLGLTELQIKFDLTIKKLKIKITNAPFTKSDEELKKFWEKEASEEAAVLQILKYSQKHMSGRKHFGGKQWAPNFPENDLS